MHDFTQYLMLDLYVCIFTCVCMNLRKFQHKIKVTTICGEIFVLSVAADQYTKN